MVNKVTLVGNLGRDPEIRRLDNGVAVGKFSVATNERYKDKNGDTQTQTEWHEVVVWRGLAEVAEKYLKKGKLVYIEGKITHRKWMDKENNERRTTEIVANTLQMLGGRDGGGSSYGNSFPTAADIPQNNNANTNTSNPTSATTPAAPVAPTVAEAPAAEDDDLPF